MSDPVVRVYVIGQTPRPDLTTDLQGRFASTRFEIVGALDGFRPADIAPSVVGGYPLETRLRDGSRIVLDADFLAPLLQAEIDAYDGDACAHVILCAGPFPDLTAPATRAGRRAPVLRPFDVAASELAARGYHRLDVMVPFAGQAAPAMDKWVHAGFACRVHVLGERPHDVDLPDWVAGLVAGGRAEAVVFDYVGFPSAELRDVAAEIEIPVFDLGHLAFDALGEMLRAP